MCGSTLLSPRVWITLLKGAQDDSGGVHDLNQ
jgi:hypothetical protein